MATSNLPMYKAGIDHAHRRVIFASSPGTVGARNDFDRCGSLAAILSKPFSSSASQTTGLILVRHAPIAFALVALTGDTYYGLRYPIIVALMTVVIGTLFQPETKDRPIN